MNGAFNRLVVNAAGGTADAESTERSQPTAGPDPAETESTTSEPATDETGLPSEHFVLAQEYREMSAVDARVMLQERTKELDAITRASELFGRLDRPVGALIETFVSELPQWLQYPDVTEARIVAGADSAESAGFRRTADPLRHDTHTDDGTEIVMEIVYTEERPTEDDGPWLTEEHELVDALISFITNYCNQWEKQAQIDAELERQRSVAAEVSEGVTETKQTANGVATSAEEIAQHAQRSADSMNEVASETEDMSATVEEIASTSEEVAMMSQEAKGLADDGSKAATEAIEVMTQIDDSTEEVSTDIGSLRDRIEEIDNIVEVINAIADQTNILALNASIEAARAGDAGSGFAVVADEVKSLASDSQEHATQIEDVIGEIKTDADHTVRSLAETTKEVNAGIEQVEASMETLEDIERAVTEASDGIQEVSDATDDQAASTEEVASMINELVEESEAVASEIQNVAAANEQQVAQVESIESTVDQLTE